MLCIFPTNLLSENCDCRRYAANNGERETPSCIDFGLRIVDIITSLDIPAISRVFGHFELSFGDFIQDLGRGR